MLSPEEIDEQQKLLATHRHTLAIYLRQRAMIGQAYSPPALISGIEEARGNIKRIKIALRAAGAEVPDDADDESTTATYTRPAALSAPGRPRRLWVWLVTIDTIVLALAIGGWWWFYGQPTSTSSQKVIPPAMQETASSREPTANVSPSEETPSSTPQEASSNPPSIANLESQLQRINILLSETQVDIVRGYISDQGTGYRSLAEHLLPILDDQRFRQTVYLDEIEVAYTNVAGEDHFNDFDEEQLKAGIVRAWNERYTDQKVESFDQIVGPNS